MSQDPEIQKAVELRTPFPSAPRIYCLVGLRASDAAVMSLETYDYSGSTAEGSYRLLE